MTAELASPEVSADAPHLAKDDLRVRQELLNLVLRDQPVALAVAWIYTLVITGILVQARPSLVPWLWLAAISLSMTIRFLAVRVYVRREIELSKVAVWERWFLVTSAISAAFWGAIGWYAHDCGIPAAFVVPLIIGVVAATSRTIACQFPAFCVFVGLTAFPLVVALVLEGTYVGFLLGPFTGLFVLLMIGVGKTFRDTVARSCRLRFENGDLAARLHRDQQALRASEEQLRFAQYALDHAQDPVVIADRGGTLMRVSEEICRQTGLSADELKREGVAAKLLSLSPDRFERLWDEVKRSGSLTFEAEMLAAGDRRTPVELSASHVAFNGREVVCLIARDIGPRRAAEQERARLARQMQEAQRLESLGVLAGGIAHDFNNLLTAIVGNSSLARDYVRSSAEAVTLLDQVERASNQAAGLCRQMLAYAGQGQVVVGPVDLSEVIRGTKELLESTVGSRAELDLELAAGLPAILGDESQIRQVVLNLVHNAAEAIAVGQGRITVRTFARPIDAQLLARARVRAATRVSDGVALEIGDNGTGMTTETSARMFEPFFTTKFTGRGLGLAAVMGIVRSHHGVLQVQSELGRGTVFQLVFPATAQFPGRTAPASPMREDIRREGRVLVVDDEDFVRKMAEQALKRMGFEVESAGDGDEALDRLRAGDANRFDLLLLDMTMPKRDGAMTLFEFRLAGVRTPAILMSGFSEDQVRDHVAEIENVEFLRKPFGFRELEQKVDATIRSNLLK